MTFTRVKILALSGSLIWMGLAFSQSTRNSLSTQDRIQDLNDKLQDHLVTAEGKIAEVSDLQRRVNIIEAGARADRLDARVARIESNVESLHSMFWGILIPVMLMGAEAIMRLIVAAQSATKKRLGSG
jgi:cell division protein FtsL